MSSRAGHFSTIFLQFFAYSYKPEHDGTQQISTTSLDILILFIQHKQQTLLSLMISQVNKCRLVIQ